MRKSYDAHHARSRMSFFIFLLFVSLITCLLALLSLIWWYNLRDGTKRPQTGTLIAVMGSGGHTAEMLSLLSSVVQDDSNRLKELLFVVTSGDRLSEQRLHLHYPQLGATSPEKRHKLACSLVHITRSRALHQSYVTSIYSSLVSLLEAFRIFATTPRAEALLCNGPGVCVPIMIASRLLSPRTTVIFVESFCRTRSLSLSGKIAYHLRLTDHFLVQWPKLFKRYHRAQYLGGILV